MTSSTAAACLPALLRVTTHVLALHDRVMTGDEDAAAEVEALAVQMERVKVTA